MVGCLSPPATTFPDWVDGPWASRADGCHFLPAPMHSPRMTPVGLECPNFILPAIAPPPIAPPPPIIDPRRRMGGPTREVGTGARNAKSGRRVAGKGKVGTGSSSGLMRDKEMERNRKRERNRRRRQRKRMRRFREVEKEKEKGETIDKEGDQDGGEERNAMAKEEDATSYFTNEDLAAARYLGACMTVMETLYGPRMGFGRDDSSESFQESSGDASNVATARQPSSPLLLSPSAAPSAMGSAGPTDQLLAPETPPDAESVDNDWCTSDSDPFGLEE